VSHRSRGRSRTTSGFSDAGLCALGLALLACSSTVSSVDPTTPDRSGVSHKQYRIECIKPDDCKRAAARTCGQSYSIVSEWNNTIPESNLPGLNAQSDQTRTRYWDRYYLQPQTGIESKDPMPLKSIVVACNG
jgi:hypothetical protein